MTNEPEAFQAVQLRKDLKDSEIADMNVALAKAMIIAEAGPLKGVLDKLAEHAAADAQFQAELARHHAERSKTQPK